MASVDFVINVKQKGMEVVQKYSKEMEEVQKTTKKLSEENKKLAASSDGVETASKRSEKAFKSLRDGTEKTESSFKKLGLTVVSALAVIGTAMGKASFELAKTLNDQATMADNLGVSFQKFQGFAAASAKAGVDLAQAYDKVYDMNKDIQEAITRGSGPAFETLKQLGVELQQFSGMDAIDRFQTISKILQGIGDTNLKNFAADEFKVKDILPLTREMENLKDISEGLKRDGLIYTEAEKNSITKFASDMNVNFNEWQTVLGKISLTILPKISETMATTQKDSKNLVKSDGIILATRLLVTLTNAVSAALSVIGILFNSINYILKSIANWIVYLVDVIPAFTSTIWADLRMTGDKLELFGKTSAQKATGWLADAAKAVGADELAANLEAASAREGVAVDKVKAKLGEKRKELGKVSKAYKEVEKNAKEMRDSFDQTDLAAAAAKGTEQLKKISQELTDMLNPDAAIERTKVETEAEDAKLETKAFFDEVQKRSSSISSDFFQKMNMTKDKAATGFDDSAVRKELSLLAIRRDLKGQAESIDEKEYARLASAQYQKIIDAPLATELQILQAKSDMAKLNIAAIDYLNKIKELQDEVSTGVKKEKENRPLIAEQLRNIVASETTIEEKLKARIALNEIEKQNIADRKEAAEKLAGLEAGINSAKATTLRDEGKSVEAFDLESKQRIKIIEKEFKDSSLLAERLELEKKIINKERLRVQLEEVKKEIEKLQNAWNDTSLSNVDGAVKTQQKINELKTQELAISKQIGETAEKNKDAWITNSQAVSLVSGVIDGASNSIGNLIAGTKSFGEVAREEFAKVASELSKILIKRALLGAIESMSSAGIGGGGGWGGNFMSIIAQAAKNHSGTIVKTDDFSGRMGLRSNETLRILEAGEGVFTKDQMDYFGDALKGNGSGGNMTVVMDTDATTRNITRSRTADKYWDRMSEERQWTK